MNIGQLQDTIKRVNYILLEIRKEQEPFKGLKFGEVRDKNVLGILAFNVLGILAFNGNHVTQTSLPFEDVADDLQKIEQARESIRQTLKDYQQKLQAKLDAVNELLSDS